MKLKVILALVVLFGAVFVSYPKPAEAAFCCKCKDHVSKLMDRLWRDGYALYFINDPTVGKALRHVEGEFTTHKQWIVGVVWEDNILPAMMMLTNDLVSVGVKQMEIVGQLFDAKIQMEAQQDLEYELVKTRKMFTPSTGICEVGTAVKSLAATERRAEINTFTISQRAQDRHLGGAFTSAMTGIGGDKKSRLAQFRENYCSKFDNNNGMDDLCKPGPAAINAQQRNKDIDFMRTLGQPWTLDADFTDEGVTRGEQDIFALAANLYGYHIARRPLSKNMGDDPDQPVTAIQQAYMKLRSLMAKRSVAENSFAALAGMKASGTGASREYLVNLLGELGVPVNEGLALTNIFSNEAGQLLGDDPSDALAVSNPLKRAKPSYHAQMEILTKKMFQNPDFYTNLYDKPANIDRKAVAMQAIGLMQKFDLLKSYLRQEASVSVLLEMAVMDMQDNVESDISR